jgi:hypothetical protein
MIRNRLLILSVALVMFAFAAACRDAAPLVGEDAGATPAAGTATASAGDAPTPDGSSTPEPLPAGIQQIFDRISELRGLPQPPQLRAELIARSDLPALLDSLLTSDDRQWFAQTTTLYRLLGTLANDQDYLTVYQGFGAGSVLGLYSPPDDQLWVVHDDGEELDFEHLPREEEATLAHELVHALQDYNFKLDEVYERLSSDLDRNLAWTAVVEGDANTFEGQYTKKYLFLPAGGGRYLLASLPLQTTPPAIQRELYFPYTTGADFVKAVVASDGSAPINEMLKDGPAATSIVMHPSLRTSGWAPQAVSLPDLSGALGAGWSMESSGTFGEFQVKNFLQDAIGASTAAKAADGWAGDHYAVYRNGDATAATFRIRFASEPEAGEFADALQKVSISRKATVTTNAGLTLSRAADGDVTATSTVSGADVLFAIGSDEGTAKMAMEALLHG